jgi:hypothetical protein
MLVGALICVETLVVVLERQAQPTTVDNSFYTEIQQAKSQAGARMYTVAPARPLAPASFTLRP